jgi:hypothetical protein
MWNENNSQQNITPSTRNYIEYSQMFCLKNVEELIASWRASLCLFNRDGGTGSGDTSCLRVGTWQAQEFQCWDIRV